MRIQIDKSAVDHSKPSTGYSNSIWNVSPGHGEKINSNDYPSYWLEVDINGIVGQEIIYMVATHGDRLEFVSEDEFNRRAQVIMDHAYKVPAGMTQQEAERIIQEDAYADAMSEDNEYIQDPRFKDIFPYTEDEAKERLCDKGVWSRKAAGALGYDMSVFDALERAWNAARVFIDFGNSSRQV